MLLTPRGKEVVTVQILYRDDVDAIDTPSEIEVRYNEKEYRGKGDDYLLVDTYVDLQKKLPDGVKIACCMTHHT